jgi:hypothetical protein
MRSRTSMNPAMPIVQTLQLVSLTPSTTMRIPSSTPARPCYTPSVTPPRYLRFRSANSFSLLPSKLFIFFFREALSLWFTLVRLCFMCTDTVAVLWPPECPHHLRCKAWGTIYFSLFCWLGTLSNCSEILQL